MKAIRVHQVGDPDVMKLEEMPTPTPGPKQVLIRVRAAGVNPVDTYLRSGKYPVTAPFELSCLPAEVVVSYLLAGPGVPYLLSFWFIYVLFRKRLGRITLKPMQ